MVTRQNAVISGCAVAAEAVVDAPETASDGESGGASW